jgi:hypothetical protein
VDHKARYYSLLKARPALAENLPGGIEIVTDPPGIERIERAMAERFAARGQPREWARAGLFYEDPYLTVLRDAVIFPNGEPGLYHRAIGKHDGQLASRFLAGIRAISSWCDISDTPRAPGTSKSRAERSTPVRPRRKWRRSKSWKRSAARFRR